MTVRALRDAIKSYGLIAMTSKISMKNRRVTVQGFINEKFYVRVYDVDSDVEGLTLALADLATAYGPPRRS